jgi:hypothetical protein
MTPRAHMSAEWEKSSSSSFDFCHVARFRPLELDSGRGRCVRAASPLSGQPWTTSLPGHAGVTRRCQGRQAWPHLRWGRQARPHRRRGRLAGRARRHPASEAGAGRDESRRDASQRIEGNYFFPLISGSGG